MPSRSGICVDVRHARCGRQAGERAPARPCLIAVTDGLPHPHVHPLFRACHGRPQSACRPQDVRTGRAGRVTCAVAPLAAPGLLAVDAVHATKAQRVRASTDGRQVSLVVEPCSGTGQPWHPGSLRACRQAGSACGAHPQGRAAQRRCGPQPPAAAWSAGAAGRGPAHSRRAALPCAACQPARGACTCTGWTQSAARRRVSAPCALAGWPQGDRPPVPPCRRCHPR